MREKQCQKENNFYLFLNTFETHVASRIVFPKMHYLRLSHSISICPHPIQRHDVPVLF